MLKLFVQEPVTYLQKSVLKMTADDYMSLVDKFTKQFSHGASGQTCDDTIALNICSALPADLFTLSGKLNKQSKKDFSYAIRAGMLPKRATIQNLYDNIVDLAKSRFSDFR